MKRLFLFATLTAVLGLVVVGCRSHPTATQGHQRPFTFVQMCDPQIGFSNYVADLARFQRAVKQINDLRPDLVVICGDLVNGATEKSFADFNAAKAKLKMPCHCAPGNHDVGNEPTPKTLQRYRKAEGADYYAVEHKGCSFVVVNAQLWKTPLKGESEKQDAWLKVTLEKAGEAKRPIFIVSHYPLFLKEPDEQDGYFNVPTERRKWLLTLMQRCGVVAILAGHTHKTSIQEFQGIQMVTSETTSRNFDNHPYGFRIWHVGDTRPYQHEFVPVAY